MKLELLKNLIKTNKDDGLSPLFSDHKWYFKAEPIGVKYTVSMLDAFKTSKKVADIVEMLEEATEQDTVIFNIASYGGETIVLKTLLHALQVCRATTIAKVNEAYSAAADFSLNCDGLMVGESSILMIHGCSSGARYKTSTNFLADAQSCQLETEYYTKQYSGFLTRRECEQVNDGVDLYFRGHDIAHRYRRMRRFQRRFGLYGEEDIVTIRRREAAEQLKKEKKKTTRKATKKKKTTKKSK